MRHLSLLLVALTAWFSAAPDAQAQWYGDNNDIIRCESRDGRTERCPTDARSAELVRQYSDSACIRNRTWGVDNYGIWVSGGCRAEFRVRGYDDNYYGGGYGGGYGDDHRGTIRCESRDGRTKRCDTGGGYAELVRQLSDSACIRNRTWGSDYRSVWVSGGCRGEFRVDGRDNGYGNGYGNGHGYGGDPGVIRCESRDNRSTTCAVPYGRRSNVRLIRQLSDTPCVEGDTWGRSSGGIWVTRGCRGEFVVARGGDDSWQCRPGDLNCNNNRPGGNGNARTMRCESNDQRTVRCPTTIYRRAELARQLSDTPCSEGGTWGWDRNGIWVTRGCRGEFRIW